MRVFKWIAIAIGGLIGLLVIAVLAIVWFVDANRFKPEIAARVFAATGRELALPGDIDLGFYPWLALATGEGSFGNAPGFSAQTCTGFFDSSLYALGLVSGQAEVDLDGGGPDESIAIAGSKITGLYARSGHLYVSESGGLGANAGGVSVYGDGDFSDDVSSGGSGITIQVLVDGFRISPF